MTEHIEKIKTRIESMSKNNQLEVLKILKKFPEMKLNENKSGIFVNLTFSSESVITELNQYIDYVNLQEETLEPLETQRNDYKKLFMESE
jgi:hypothetical protein